MGELRKIDDGLAAAFASLEGLIATDEEIAAYEAGRERDARLDRLHASGITEHLLPENIDHVVARKLRRTDATDLVARWLAYQTSPRRLRDGSKPTLVLIGAMGCGKTVAAADLIATDGGRYVQAEDLARLQSARFGDERAEYQRLMSIQTLVVDEVGTEENGERARAALHDVIDRRRTRRTLLLGNVTKDQLRERLDARTVDRLRECAVVAVLAGPSLRRGTL